MTTPDYRVYVSSFGNVFMTEIAESLVQAMARGGRAVQLHRTGLPRAEAGVRNLVVAPHEYFTLYDGASEADIVKAASNSISLGVEQPGTYWFEYGIRYASYGPLAMDINRRGVNELRRRGVEAYRLQPGYHPDWDVWGGGANDRPCDVLFLGSLTARRAAVLAQAAPILSQWSCDLRLFLGDRPVRQESEHFVVGQRKREVLTNSRVLLNVHQGDRDYFEWIRVLEAMTNGCLVVTEASGGYAPLVPFRHFLQAPVESLIGQVDAILRSEDQQAYDFIRRRMDFVESVDRLLTLVERRLATLWPSGSAVSRPEGILPRVGRRSPAPQSSGRPQASEIAQDQSVDEAGRRDTAAQLALKDIMLSELSDARLMEATIAALEHGSEQHVVIDDTAGYDAATPKVSVILAHYNYGAFVRDAISSVVAASDVDVELVIIDNHSDADQLATLRSIVAEFDWFPIRLIARSADGGPSSSRNLGAQHARGEFFLLLDADNMLYPTAASALAHVLETTDAAFAYGIIEKFGGESGLLSAIDWDVDRLVQAPYIDTMALIRRTVWEEFGGFDPRIDAMGGYDDYGFWLQVAEAGYRGQLVTSFIGRYRVHGVSWQSLLNVDTTEFMQFYRDRHPSLPWPDLERTS
jgi:hypothetical protein